MKAENIKSILIIGIAGGLAKITAGLLAKKYPNASIFGVDSRPIKNVPDFKNIKYKSIRYSRGTFENIFRSQQFDVVLHLGRMSHTTKTTAVEIIKRLKLNVMGTSNILDLCLEFSVKKVSILSTFHVYGAFNDTAAFLNEDSPLRASIKHPELRDVVDMDQISTNWMWKNKDLVETNVFRPCNIIGPQIKNAMSNYLSSNKVPVPIDYNPMFQFIHEFDMANILCESLEKVPTGIYNIAPNEVISITEAKKSAGTKGIPMPFFLLDTVAKLLNKTFFQVPDYLIEYFKFSCLLDNSELQKHLGDDFYRYDIRDTLSLFKNLY